MEQKAGKVIGLSRSLVSYHAVCCTVGSSVRAGSNEKTKTRDYRSYDAGYIPYHMIAPCKKAVNYKQGRGFFFRLLYLQLFDDLYLLYCFHFFESPVAKFGKYTARHF